MLLMAMALTCLFLNYANANEVHNLGGINKDQPIAIGELIFSQLVAVNRPNKTDTYLAQYFFIGVENNCIKVKYQYEQSSIFGEDEETVTLSLPLNDNRKALLKIKKQDYIQSRELIITIVDEFNRISVEEHKK